MATSGWLIIGVPITLPKVPTFEIVKVLPLISSPANLFSLAFPANSFTLAAIVFKSLVLAFFTTGTIKFPLGNAVAIPILISSFTIIVLPSTEAFIFGKSFTAFATASTNNGVKVKRSPCFSLNGILLAFLQFTILVISAST